jgi:hypothetical protein
MFIKYNLKQNEKLDKLILPDSIKNESDLNKLILLKKKIAKKYFKEIIDKLLSTNLNYIKNLTLESIEILSNNNKKIVYSILKKHYGEFSDVNILNELSNNPNDIVKACVAANKNCSAETLIKLYSNEDKNIKKEAYVNIKNRLANITFVNTLLFSNDTPGPILKLIHLKYKNDPRAKYITIKHPNFPAKMLGKLSNDEFWDIRAAVAENSNCPASILEELSNDKDRTVRESAVCNTNCPISILEKLKNDKSICVTEICNAKLNSLTTRGKNPLPLGGG